jgi:hypothetical protein
MSHASLRLFRLFLVAAFAVTSAPAFAAAQRTFVASTGSDANACSLVAPCRTFGRAITQTSAGGEVIVLDSGGYGPVTIAQSVSIIAPPGIYAGISVAGLNNSGVNVVGAGIAVTLRGLTINSTTSNTYTGIWFANGATLSVERCAIRGFSIGIFATADGSKLDVADTTVREFTLAGINIGAGTFADIRATLTRVRVESGAGDGIGGQAGATVGVFSSTVAGNAGWGIRFDSSVDGLATRAAVMDTLLEDNAMGGATVYTNGAGHGALLSIAHSTIAHSAFYGVRVVASTSSAAVATITDSVITDHSTGLALENGAIAHVAGNTITRNGFGYLIDGSSTINSLKTSYVFGNSVDVSGAVTTQTGQ